MVTIIFLLISTSIYSQFNFSYVANIPKAPIGVHFSYLNDVGFYIDFKTGLYGDNKKAEFYEDLSYSEAKYEFGDPEKPGYSDNLVIDGGIIIKIVADLYIYGGLGYVIENKYSVFYDPMHILGNSDNLYCVEAPDQPKGKVNINVGLLYARLQKVSFLIGYDMLPSGINLGIGYTF